MKSFAIAVSIASLAVSGAAQAATQVQATSTMPTLLGTFGPGTYTFTTTGIISLTGGNDFLVNAEGVPQGPVTTPGYSDFNPSGSFTADGNCGPAGCGIKIGALAGTFDQPAQLAVSSSWAPSRRFTLHRRPLCSVGE